MKMTKVEGKNIENKPGSSQVVEQISIPPSTKDDEKLNKSEDSATPESSQIVEQISIPSSTKDDEKLNESEDSATPGSSQIVEQISIPHSTKDDEKLIGSEDSADSESGLEKKVKEISPLLQPSTPVEDVPDVSLDNDAGASAEALEEPEQGSTASASDTNSHPVADGPRESLFGYVIRRAFCHPLWWLCVTFGGVLLFLYILQELSDMYEKHSQNAGKPK